VALGLVFSQERHQRPQAKDGHDLSQARM